MFNAWYFLMLFIFLGLTAILYFILRKKSQKTQKIVLFSILLFGLILHFLKFLIPPYSTDLNRLYHDSWFINICGANIFLFPFFFLSKSKRAKDYMFYIGVLSGLISLFYPMEPMLKTNQSAEWLDILRFYFHHTSLFAVPLLMVLLNHHKLSYRRVLFVPTYLLGVMLFIMANQVLQSELGFIPLRGDNIFEITYKNSSMIWGPNGAIGEFLACLCPNFFKIIPVGEFAGQEKFWPWFWLIFPCYILLTPICFLISLAQDHKNFCLDMKKLRDYVEINILKTYSLNKNGTRTYNERIIDLKIKKVLKSHNKFVK